MSLNSTLIAAFMVGSFVFSVIILLIVLFITGEMEVKNAVVLFLVLLATSEVISLALMVKMARSMKMVLYFLCAFNEFKDLKPISSVYTSFTFLKPLKNHFYSFHRFLWSFDDFYGLKQFQQASL